MCNIKNKKLISIIVILFLSMIPTTALSQSPYRCVSTGINSFEHLSELSYSVKNALDIGQALEKKGGFSVSYLLGKNENNVIDKQSVLNSLTFNEDELLNIETFIFYFNGHGLNYYGKNYLALTNSTTSDVSTLLSLEELFVKLRKISEKNINVIVFLDACKNTMGSQSLDSYGWVDEENDKELQVLYSTSDLGRSYESYEIKSSVFSYYLIDALNGYAPDLDGDDVVSFDEVVHYVKKNMINWSKQHGFQQIPKTGSEKLVKSLWITFIDKEQVLLKQKEQSAQKYILKAQKVFLEKNKKTLQKSHYEKIAQYYNNSIKLYENIYNENPLRIHIYNKISTLKSIIEIIKKLNKSLDSIDKKQFKHAYFELLNTRSKILHNLKLQDYLSVKDIELKLKQINTTINKNPLGTFYRFSLNMGLSLFGNLNNNIGYEEGGFLKLIVPSWDLSLSLYLNKNWSLGIGMKMFYINLFASYSIINTYGQSYSILSTELTINIAYILSVFDKISMGGETYLEAKFNIGEVFGIYLSSGLMFTTVLNGNRENYFPINLYLKAGVNLKI